MILSQKKNGKNRIVEAQGSLTVANCAAFKTAILENLKKGYSLELVIGDVTDVDLSFIQILAAVMQAVDRDGRKFRIRTPVPEILVESIKLSGLLNHNKCGKPGCVWCSINDQIQGV